VGLATIMGCKMAGAKTIVSIFVAVHACQNVPFVRDMPFPRGNGCVCSECDAVGASLSEFRYKVFRETT
jgi:hypothetical protein